MLDLSSFRHRSVNLDRGDHRRSLVTKLLDFNARIRTRLNRRKTGLIGEDEGLIGEDEGLIGEDEGLISEDEGLEDIRFPSVPVPSEISTN